MALKDEIPKIVTEFARLSGIAGTFKQTFQFDYNRRSYESTIGVLEHNRQLFDIYEGDLLVYVLSDLRKQLSEKSFEQVQHRVAPINVLRRIIDKLSKIYAEPPKREVEGGADKDIELIEWYKEKFEIDSSMSLANEFFNLFKCVAIEPYISNGEPGLRIIPADRFFVYSSDPTDPTRPTHFIKVMGTLGGPYENGSSKTLLYVYTDTEFLAIDNNGVVQEDIMAKLDNVDGVNPYGVIPFIYVNRSKHELIPKPDSDTLQMSKLIPVLISDINYAVMFQSFSIIYGIDLDQEGLTLSPNAFWSFKSDPNKEGKPTVGVIKPEVDTDKVLNLIKTELTFWMQSRSIKPGAIGTIQVENAASGISKAIDEMDTSEDRKKQVPYFREAEKKLWDLVIRMHPIWMRQTGFEQKMAFSPGVEVCTDFADQAPIIDSSKQVDDVIKKLNAGIQSRKGAILELYPEWTEEDAEDKIIEIEQERTVSVIEDPQVDDGMPQDMMNQQAGGNMENMSPMNEPVQPIEQPMEGEM